MVLCLLFHFLFLNFLVGNFFFSWFSIFCCFKIGGIRVHVKTQNMVHYMVLGEKNYNKKYILKMKLLKQDIERVGVDSFSFCAKCEFDILDATFFSFKFVTFLFIGEKHIFIPIFSHDSHFGPYILFSPLLVPVQKKVFCFSPFRQCRQGTDLRGKRNY